MRSSCNTLPAPALLGDRRTRDRAIVKCACGRVTDKSRKGRCPPCALREHRGHQIDPSCAVCELADRRVLRRLRLADGWVTTCANHAALAGRRVLTLAELRAEAVGSPGRRTGDRRIAVRRTVAQPVAEERRAG